MCQIMDDLHKYVPSQESTQNMELHDGGSIQFTDSVLRELLFGGDQKIGTPERHC